MPCIFIFGLNLLEKRSIVSVNSSNSLAFFVPSTFGAVAKQSFVISNSFALAYKVM